MEPADEVVARRIGQKLGDRWTLERLLGTGGMAAVYAAHDDTGAVFAIKILHPEMSLRRDVRERFLREAYVANKIGHPGAVAVLEHFDGGEQQSYLVMQLLEGEPLSDRVRRQGALPIAELFDYLDQVLDVLVRAHDQGIVHRDLKPDNLFVTRDGQVKILDFGVARVLHDAPGAHKTRTGMALGTLPYMAPEQALGRREEIDGRADLFSLGATAFRILAGRKVHEADSDAELLIAMASKPAPPLASVLPSAPGDVCAVVDLALAFSREARYPDARTMQADVRAVRRGEPPPFATRRLSAREQSTRLDMPAVVLPAAAAAVAAPVGAQRTPTVVAPQRAGAEPMPLAVAPSAAPVQKTPTVVAATNAAAQRTPTVVAPQGAAQRTPTVVAPPGAAQRTPTVVAPQGAAQRTPTAGAPPGAAQRTPTVVAGSVGEAPAPVSAPGAALAGPVSERAQPVSAPGTFVPAHVTAPGAAAPAPAEKKSSKLLLIAAGVLALAALGGAAALAFGGGSADEGSGAAESTATAAPTSEAPAAAERAARTTTGSTAATRTAAPSSATASGAPASAAPPAEKRGKGHGRGKGKH